MSDKQNKIKVKLLRKQMLKLLSINSPDNIVNGDSLLINRLLNTRQNAKGYKNE